MRRNQFVLIAVVAALAVMFWAGFANYERRKQEHERAMAQQAVLVQNQQLEAVASGDAFHSPLEGKPAPAFTLEDVHGRRVSLKDYKGKALLINFWATWCAPCRIETPWLIDFHKQYASQGFEVLGISADDLDLNDKAALAKEKRDIAKFATDKGMEYPVLLNGLSLSKTYGGLDNFPTSFLVDRKGVVVATLLGLHPKDEIEANIRKVVESKP